MTARDHRIEAFYWGGSLSFEASAEDATMLLEKWGVLVKRPPAERLGELRVDGTGGKVSSIAWSAVQVFEVTHP